MGRLILKRHRKIVKCSWCDNEFSVSIGQNKDDERSQVRCNKCFRFLPSSIKVSDNNIVGKKHYHKEYPNEIWEK